MRSLLIWSDTVAAPAPPRLPAAEGLPDRPDYLPSFDPDRGIVRDGETTYLIVTVGPEAFDGRMVAPAAIVAVIRDPESGEEIAEGRRPVFGPGPIAVPAEGLVVGQFYRMDLIAEYDDAPDGEPVEPSGEES